MKTIIEHIFEELMDAEEYKRLSHECKNEEMRGVYRTLASEELGHAERLIDAGDKIEKTSEENFLWDFERERALKWWKNIRREINAD